MHKPKVFVIGVRAIPDFQGGIEKQAELLYPLLTDDFDITIATMRKYQKLKRWNNITIKRFFSFPHKKFEKVVYSLWATLYAVLNKPHIVHIQGIGASLFIPLLKISNIKVVLHYRSQDYYYPKWGWFGKKVLKIAERISVSLSEITIVVAERFKEELKKEYPEKNIIYIPNIVRINQNKDDSVLKKYGLKSRKYILSVGRITPEKNFELLIKAFKKSKTDKKLVIVGGKDKKDYYEKLLKLAAEDRNILFTGELSHDQLNALYDNAYMFILASVFEGTPNVVLEAASFNIPIYLSNIPAHKELRFQKGAYFANEEDLIRILKSTPKLYYNREELLKQYDAKKVTEKITEIFKKLINEN